MNPENIFGFMETRGDTRIFMDKNEDDRNKVSLAILWPGEIAKRWFVIVEMYDHKRYGRGKREYLKEFTESERKLIGHYYRLLYNWYLRTGCPDKFGMKINTYLLLDRAAAFFAGL